MILPKCANMKHARKIRINGEDYKYFVDTGATNEDDEKVCRVILYHIDGKRSFWNGAPKKVTGAQVKQAVVEGKFNHLRV